MASDLRIGISGWRYAPWRGVFYPKGLAQRLELQYAARHFNSLELNGSFYSLQRPELYRSWYEDTPDDFVFAVKGSRYITHLKRLHDVDEALATFFASGLLCLEHKLGPILWQFPAWLPCELERFEAFFALLPRDTQAASKLARKHSPWLAERAAVSAHATRPLRYAIEARSKSCAQPAMLRLLRKHGLACVVADAAGRFPYIEDVTADFMYLRLHGDKRLYESGYSRAALARWAERIRLWRAGSEPKDARRVLSTAAPRARSRDVYVYFDNDVKVHAPFDAAALAEQLSVQVTEPLAQRGM